MRPVRLHRARMVRLLGHLTSVSGETNVQGSPLVSAIRSRRGSVSRLTRPVFTCMSGPVRPRVPRAPLSSEGGDHFTSDPLTALFQTVNAFAPHNLFAALFSGQGSWTGGPSTDPPIEVIPTRSAEARAELPGPKTQERIRPLQRTQVRRSQKPVQRVRRPVLDDSGQHLLDEYGQPAYELVYVESTDARPTFTSIYSRHAGPGTRRGADYPSWNAPTRQEMGVTKGLGSTSYTKPGEDSKQRWTIYTAAEQAARVRRGTGRDEVLTIKSPETITRPTAGMGSARRRRGQQAKRRPYPLTGANIY